MKSKNKKTKFETYKERAAKHGLVFDLEEAFFEGLCKSPCFYCGAIYPGGSGVDRVKNGHGYLKTNVVSSCIHCNQGKRHRTIGEWVKHCQAVVDHATKKKVDALFEPVQEDPKE